MEAVAAIAIGLVMVSLARRAMQPPVVPVVAIVDARPSAARSAQAALDALQRDLERLAPPQAGKPEVVVGGAGADGRGPRISYTLADGESITLGLTATPQSAGIHGLERNAAPVPGVYLRGLSFRLVASTGFEKTVHLEVALEACDSDGRESVQRLEVKTFRTSKRLK